VWLTDLNQSSNREFKWVLKNFNLAHLFGTPAFVEFVPSFSADPL
jgi:hypothetical protein